MRSTICQVLLTSFLHGVLPFFPKSPSRSISATTSNQGVPEDSMIART